MIPMSALGVHLGDRHILSEILGKELSREEVFSFYSDLAYLFYDVVMRLFKIGIVPEIHGQNCCLVLERNQVKGLLLRDHDSVRLHQPYLDKHGIGDPGYRIRPGYSNSLYNETIHKLIFTSNRWGRRSIWLRSWKLCPARTICRSPGCGRSRSRPGKKRCKGLGCRKATAPSYTGRSSRAESGR